MPSQHVVSFCCYNKTKKIDIQHIHVCKKNLATYMYLKCVYMYNKRFVFISVILTWKHFNNGFLANQTNGAWNIGIIKCFHVTLKGISLIFRAMNVIVFAHRAHQCTSPTQDF